MSRIETLRSELTVDPLGLGYAALMPDCPGTVVELLSAPTQTMHKPRMVSWRGLYASFGIGPALAQSVLAKVRAAAPQSQLMYDVERMLYSVEGFDIGDPTSVALIEGLDLFTAEEKVALLGMSMQPASRAEVLGLGAVAEAEITEAWGS